nr:hypothetical protein CFP56_08009 [Quercus suber]
MHPPDVISPHLFPDSICNELRGNDQVAILSNHNTKGRLKSCGLYSTRPKVLFQTLKPTSEQKPSPRPRLRNGQRLLQRMFVEVGRLAKTWASHSPAIRIIVNCRSLVVLTTTDQCDQTRPACGACQRQGESQGCSHNTPTQIGQLQTDSGIVIAWQLDKPQQPPHLPQQNFLHRHSRPRSPSQALPMGSSTASHASMDYVPLSGPGDQQPR